MIQRRIDNYHQINKKIIFDKNKCKDVIKNKLVYEKKIGEGFSGEVKKYHIKNSPKTVVVIKKIDKNQDGKKEVLALIKVTKLVLNQQIINLPILYNMCLENKKINLIFEYYDLNMAEWCQNKHNRDEWLKAYFQIFAGLYSLEKYTNILLYDVKFDNIMIKKLKQNKNLEYTIDNIKYILPNCSNIFILIDFGLVDFTKNNKKMYTLDNITNNYIRLKNVNTLKENELNKKFKEKCPKLYCNMIKEIKEDYNNKKIKLKYIEGNKMKIADEQETIDYYLQQKIEEYSTKDNIYQKIIEKEKYQQQPNKIISMIEKIKEPLDFSQIFPNIFSEYKL